ncbi:MAG: LacI family DNA-binding transcriptional regulator, partial [Opitutales bacterium]|nr:LacI family DNA-binding transcriptional regulator [Opitutales bacterium]
MKVTQRDIAQRIGVSTSLVSRVLSGQAHKIGVHPKKIEEIIKVAKEMNYVPSPAALILKGKKSRTVGIVAYDFNDPYFSFLISELQELSHTHNYSLLLVGF